MTTARTLRDRARQLERIEKSLTFLAGHPDLEPSISIVFKGFQDDGRDCADLMQSMIMAEWPKIRRDITEEMRAQMVAIANRWKDG